MNEPMTRISLLARLADAKDAEAWATFVEIYRPLLHRLIQRWQGRDVDHEDVIQEVLVAVSSRIARFDHRSDGAFRAWLAQITRNKLVDQWKRSARVPDSAGGTDFQRWLLEQPDVASPSGKLLETRWDMEQRRAVFLWAASKVRRQVRENTWQAFERTSLRGEQVADVAQQLEQSIGWVYVARSRVLRRLQQTVAAWDDTLSPIEEPAHEV